MAQKSLQVYRTLLRSACQAFKEDVGMLAAARQEIRSKMEGSRSVADAAELEQKQAEGLEAADFLRSAIVQATVNDRGNLHMPIAPDQVGSYVERVEPGMPLPRERRKKKKPTAAE